MKKILAFLVLSAMLLTMLIPAQAIQAGGLSFGEDGTFTVLQISDPQDDHNPAYDMLNLISLSIEQTDPDLIVFTGDIVEDSRIGDLFIDDESGREGVETDDYATTLANVEAACAAVFEKAEKDGIPFAVTQGNNDYKSGVTNEDWMRIYSEYENCLVADESGDSTGRIDYNLEIKSSDGKSAFNLWLMDTATGSVNEEQLAWYKAESAKLTAENGGKPVPSFVFQHIPTDDIGNLFEECNIWDEGARMNTDNGTKFYRLNKEIANGYNASSVAPGTVTEQFKAWKECGDVVGAYFGHWHTEGYTGIYDGVELGFTYGCEFAKTGPYGVRVFTLYEDDVLNYDNELYVYEGRVRTDDAKLVKQIDEPYKTYDNPVEKFFAAFGNVFQVFALVVKSWFS